MSEGPVVEEADVPVMRLDVGIYGWDGLVAPWWYRDSSALAVVRCAEENVCGRLVCDEWYESERGSECCVYNLFG